ERGVLDTARALSLALDRQLDGSITSLNVLSTSPHLTTGNLDGFYDECAELLKLYSPWNNVLLFDPSGKQIFNSLQPLGTPLPDAVDLPHFHDVVRSRRPGVSNLVEWPVLRRQLVSVRFPVVRDDHVKYVL